MKVRASATIIEQLAKENRRILSDWRATLLLRRATSSLSPSERRWTKAPTTVMQSHPLLIQMERNGELRHIPSLRNIYEITVPYARTGVIEEDEVLMEIHPYASISHLSALAFHGLTDELPQVLTVFVPANGTGDLLPPGTNIDDWESLALIHGRSPAHLLGQPMRWTRIGQDRYFGAHEYRPRGYPIRVTTPERTLLDGLLQPEMAGGLTNVLKAWATARDTLNLDTLIAYVDRFNINVLRQRVGFILEELRLTHPDVATWQAQAKRGGSSKLIASRPYEGRYSERWNLSLNAPTDALYEDAL